MRARIVVATLAGAFVLPAGLASAAGLSPFAAQEIGAARANVAACGAVASFPTNAFTLATDGTVTHAQVSIDLAGCAGARVDVSLVHAPSSAVVGSGFLASVSLAACPVNGATNVCSIPISSPQPGLDRVTSIQILTTKP